MKSSPMANYSESCEKERQRRLDEAVMKMANALPVFVEASRSTCEALPMETAHFKGMLWLSRSANGIVHTTTLGKTLTVDSPISFRQTYCPQGRLGSIHLDQREVYRC